VRLYVLTRHARSSLNDEGRINGDPSVPVPLTADGRSEAARLGHQLAELPLDLCVHTRFARTRETAECILAGREVPMGEEPLLDDIDVGDLEGRTLAEYHAWKQAHTRADPFPGGESLDDAARRYARAFRRLLERKEDATLVVCHEIPIRYALNAAAGSEDLDAPEHVVPNATPYLFDATALERAAARIESLVR
jgi:broad specificity phosphatase PhoE